MLDDTVTFWSICACLCITKSNLCVKIFKYVEQKKKKLPVTIYLVCILDKVVVNLFLETLLRIKKMLILRNLFCILAVSHHHAVNLKTC